MRRAASALEVRQNSLGARLDLGFLDVG